MSSTENELYKRLLDSGMSEEQLEEELERRVKEFGGFMTKQGVLFVIAKEHGVNPYNDAFYKELDGMVDYDELSITVSEVKEQMANIVLIGRVSSFSEPHDFVRKDTSVGKVSSLILADWTGQIKVVLWDEIVEEIALDQIRKGVIVRIIGGYSKLGVNNSLEVHVGKKGRIVIAPKDLSKAIQEHLNFNIDQAVEEKRVFPQFSIEKIIEKYSFIKRLQGEVHIEQFKEITKKSGERTFLLRLIISDSSAIVPLSIWGMAAVDSLKLLDEGCTVEITNVSVKENSYTKNKELVFTSKSSIRVM